MKYGYKLEHKKFVELDEDNEKVFNTKSLGFFSSEEKCKDVIPKYLEQPGFKDHPNGFVIEKVEADIDDFNEVAGDFKSSVFYLSHEWYDGEYDHVSRLGYYSTQQKAEKAQALYSLEPEFIDHPDGFCIDEYALNERGWTEGFFTY